MMTLIEKWKICLDRKGYIGVVLMDLSKAFDTINHELPIAKLHANSFSSVSYLSNRFQCLKINTAINSWI